MTPSSRKSSLITPIIIEYQGYVWLHNGELYTGKFFCEEKYAHPAEKKRREQTAKTRVRSVAWQ